MATKLLEPGGDVELVWKYTVSTPVLLGKWYASFMPVLMKVLPLTEGKILELGTGIYSTPYLHWYAFYQKRKLVSYENSKVYAKHASQYVDEFHDVFHVDSFEEVDVRQDWGMVLIDCFPLEEREQQVKRLANYAKCIVLHDSNKEICKDVFKYRFDYEDIYPSTSVFSNFINVTDLEI